ncbi:MAG: 5'/3'-nucleotidase SurE [Candidatus Cloacimonetes bacterium]|nr:5'/3'-nucleotidase SurE [Candidatus Cloacimonadota bacterium]
MNILLTNDDGINAPGIRCLAEHLRTARHNVTIIAPDRERSAASHSLSLRRPIRVDRIADNEFAVGGTPVDCVIIALQKLVRAHIDLVISGINAGQNMGEDIIYSGTVAAAVEASFFGFKALAVSLNTYRDHIFETAARWVVRLIDDGITDLIQARQIININVPNIDHDLVRGVRLTCVGHRKYYNFIKILDEDEHGFDYQIGGDQPIWDLHRGTDAEAVGEGFVSLTPLGFDMTRGDAFPPLLEWLEEHDLLLLESKSGNAAGDW